MENSDVAKVEGTQPGVEAAFRAERLQADPAHKAAKPGGKLVWIARVDDLEFFQSNRHRLVRFRPIQLPAQGRNTQSPCECAAPISQCA